MFYLRVDSKYASISDRFQMFLRPVLDGFGKFGLDLIHLVIVILSTFKYSVSSFILKVSSDNVLIKTSYCIDISHYIAFFFICNKKIMMHCDIL